MLCVYVCVCVRVSVCVHVGNKVIRMNKVSYKWEGKPLIRDFTYEFQPGVYMCVCVCTISDESLVVIIRHTHTHTHTIRHTHTCNTPRLLGLARSLAIHLDCIPGHMHTWTYAYLHTRQHGGTRE